jgi:Flp pilus assembly protein TadG
MKNNIAKSKRKKASGLMGSLILSSLIIISVGIGALALDISHIIAAKNDLQKAVDAAALAGAEELTANPELVEYHALQIAANNKADGRFVANDSDGTSVTVGSTPSIVDEVGTVTVRAEMDLRHMAAPIFGRVTDRIGVCATASAKGPLTTIFADQAFPMTVSLDTAGKNNNGQNVGKALKDHKLGDSVKFYINSQQVKNAAFTSFTLRQANANYIKDAVDQSLGLAEVQPGFIPSISVGDEIYLNNGVVGQKELAKGEKLDALIAKVPYVVAPVILGDPSFNQTRVVVGFVALKITDVEVSQSGGLVETITATLIKASVKGHGGPVFDTGDDLLNQSISEIAASPPRLIMCGGI